MRIDIELNEELKKKILSKHEATAIVEVAAATAILTKSETMIVR